MKSRVVMTEDTPRIYVASLADYNAGTHCGKWLDLEDYADADELLAAIGAMLKECDESLGMEDGQPREEWAVHDYEGFPERFYSEHMGFAKVYEWLELTADMSDERKEALEIFINNGHDAESFDNYYLGYYGGETPYDDDKTAQEFVEEMFWESHTKDEIPASIRNYIDFTSMARDQIYSGDVWVNSGHCFRG
jgi:antirestriction protein